MDMGMKSSALKELLAHLDERDGASLKSAMQPQGIEVTKVSALDGDPMAESDETSPGMGGEELATSEGEMPAEGGALGELSDEEIAELIEALQSKLG